MERFIRCQLACLILAAVLWAPAAGQASGGEITRAEIRADSIGSFSGWVEWAGCAVPGKEPDLHFPGTEPEPPLACDLSPYLTIAHGSDPAECQSADRRLPDLGVGVTMAWVGGEHTYSANLAFEVEGVPLPGQGPQLACLSAIERVPRAVFCVQVYPSPCPDFKLATHLVTFDAAPLSGPPAALPAAASTLTPTAGPLPRRKAKCEKEKRAKKQLKGRKCGKRSDPRRHKDRADR